YADGHAEQPVVGQRFRPQRIDFEHRRLDRRPGPGLAVEHRLAGREHGQHRDERRTDDEIAPALCGFHRVPLLVVSSLARMLDAGKLLVNWLAAPLLALLLALPACAIAHDIPTDVLVNAFVKPEGQRLRLLVRVPMKGLRDVDYPRRGAGLLDLARADASLANAASLWIGDELELYGGETRLAPA